MITNIFLIAGEKSGDDIGGRLIGALQKENPQLKFHGIGGSAMEKLGLKSLFQIDILSVMGFTEVLPKIFQLMSKINLTVKTIQQLQPDLVVTIDLPGFNYRVEKKLREQGYRGKIIHYVAPTVWAYKTERANKFAAYFDLMLCILPFEPKYFKNAGMKALYVGNPVIEQALTTQLKARDKVKKILILPGSRKQELKMLLPVYKEALSRLAKNHKFSVVILNFAENISLIEQIFSGCPFKYEIATPTAEEKMRVISKCDLALSKSGTVTTEIALAGVPLTLAHKVNFISYFIIKRLIKITQICLVNIIAGKQIVPELIQDDCNPAKIANLLDEYIERNALRQKQVRESYAIFKKLGLGDKLTPSTKAAKAILACLG